MLTSDATAFEAAIGQSPDDDAPKLVYADWLEECGATARSQFYRWLVAKRRQPYRKTWGNYSCSDLDRSELPRRLYEAVANQVEPRHRVHAANIGVGTGNKWVKFPSDATALESLLAAWLTFGDDLLAEFFDWQPTGFRGRAGLG